jgi:hypothetical protein
MAESQTFEEHILHKLGELSEKMDTLIEQNKVRQSNRNKMYQNQGSKWTNEEREQLLSQVREHKSLAEIAKSHERSAFAINCQLSSIVEHLRKENKTQEEIISETGLTADEVKHLNNIRNNSQQRRYF